MKVGKYEGGKELTIKFECEGVLLCLILLNDLRIYVSGRKRGWSRMRSIMHWQNAVIMDFEIKCSELLFRL